MKKAVTIISLICVIIITGVVLVVTGVIDPGSIFGGAREEEAIEPAAFIMYMDSYIAVDEEGTVIAAQKDKPSDIPELTGISITKMLVNEPLETDNMVYFRYALDVLREINKRKLEGIREIFTSAEGEITLYVQKVKIQMGREDDTKGKLEALSNFYDKLLDYSGVLDLTEGSTGYVLKPDTNLEN